MNLQTRLDLNKFIKKLVLPGVLLAAAFMMMGLKSPSVSAQNVNISSPRNCDANAVIWCGFGSVNQLITIFNNGDGHNSAVSIQNIYSFFGITRADIETMNTAQPMVQVGTVTSNGNVMDGSGKLVATNAITGGRQNIAGSTEVIRGNTTFFVRPTSLSFASNSLPALIVMENGRFAFAILSSCGNAVKATPTPVTPTPTPKPKPVPRPHSPKVVKTTRNVTCSGNTTNSNSGIASQGGNCSNNTTVVQTENISSTSNTSTTNTTSASTTSTSTVTPTEVSATSTTPTSLVNTGPGDLIGVFVLTTVFGTLGYHAFLKRRLS